MIRLSRFAGCFALLVVTSLAGCGALVGAECRSPLSRCGHVCVDLQTDRANCGACGNACNGGTTCASGVCRAPGDGGAIDGGLDAGRSIDAGDAASDAMTGPIDAQTDGSVDAGGWDGAADAGPQCGLGELQCATGCVDPNEPSHCGSCTRMCLATEVCAAGACTPTCAPLADCGGSCADLTSDPDHCGSCATSCASGICIGGLCQAALAGHLVVIGHDFEERRITMSQIVANAVLLPGRASVRLVVWEGAATAAARSGTYAAIVEGAGSRTYVTTVVSDPVNVSVLLESADTFLVLAQAGATDAQLTALGAMWSTALGQFLGRGGVVVVLEAPSAQNQGTYQVLVAAGLFVADARAEIVHPILATVAGRAGDPVLIGVPLSYRGETHTSFYTTLDADAIVSATQGPVVIDRTVTPH